MPRGAQPRAQALRLFSRMLRLWVLAGPCGVFAPVLCEHLWPAGIAFSGDAESCLASSHSWIWEVTLWPQFFSPLCTQIFAMCIYSSLRGSTYSPPLAT